MHKLFIKICISAALSNICNGKLLFSHYSTDQVDRSSPEVAPLDRCIGGAWVRLCVTQHTVGPIMEHKTSNKHTNNGLGATGEHAAGEIRC